MANLPPSLPNGTWLFIADASDLPAEKPQEIDLVVLLTGCELHPGEVAGRWQIPVYHLNSLTPEAPDARELSLRLSAGIVAWADACLPPDPIYRDPLNEIFSVHLREQFDLIERLRLLLLRGQPQRIELAGPRSTRYYSPERPNEGRGFRESSVRLFLAETVAREAGVEVRSRGKSDSPFMRLIARATLFRGYKALRLLQKAKRGRSLDSQPTGEADALFLVRGAAAARNAIPIVQKLQTQGIQCRVLHDDLIHEDGGFRILQEAGLHPIATGRHGGMRGAVSAILRSFGRPKIRDWNTTSADPTIECLRQVGAFREMGRRVADTDFQERWFESEFRTELARCRPSVVLSNSIFDQWGVLSARITHERGLRYVLMHKVLYSPIRYPHIGWCDAFCVANQAFAQRMRAVGWPADSIVATGMPGLTPEAEVGEPPQAGRGICVTTQPVAHGENVALIRAAMAVGAERELPVNLKLHPREPRERYQNLVDELRTEYPGVDCTIFQSETLEAVYAQSQILLSRSSTTVLTALIYGLPVLALRSMTINTYGLDFLEHPATEVFDDIAELESHLHQWVSDRDQWLPAFLRHRTAYLEQVATTDSELPALDAIAEVVHRHMREDSTP